MSNEIEELRKLVKHQSRQISQLRSKLFKLHEAFVLSNKSSVSDLHPFEIIDNNSDTTYIAFGGMLTSLGMPKKEFFGSAFDSDCNFIFLKDFWQCWYQKGLLGYTDDIDSTVKFIKDILPSETRTIICVGTSSGGFASILFAELLNANMSISFSPQTYIDKKTFIKFRSPDSRWQDLEYSNYLNLKDHISGNVVHNLHVGSKNNYDMQHANLVAKLDCVKILTHDTDTHNTAAYLKSADKLKESIML